MKQQNCVDQDPSAKIQWTVSYPNAHHAQIFKNHSITIILPTGKQTSNVKNNVLGGKVRRDHSFLDKNSVNFA